MNGDSLTVLHSVGDLYATKRLRRAKDGKIQNRSYGNAKHFRVRIIAVADFPALCAALNGLVRKPFAFVIRGAPKPGINLNHTRRLVHRDRKTGDEATFAAATHHWFALDLDHIPAGPLTDPATDPGDAVEYLITRLPGELADSSFWWQWTSSQSLPGHEGTLSARLWFWSERPLSDAELTRWAKAVNRDAHLIDPCLFRPVQAHYIAEPIFQGWPDPLPQRSGVRHGLEDTVALVLPPPAKNKPDDIAGDGYEPARGVDAYLAQIGSVEAGFREPIRSAIASFTAIYGSRADCEDLKKAIVKAIDRAVEDGHAGIRGEDVIARYRSDQHLDELIAWVREHHGDQPPKGWTGDIPTNVIDDTIPIEPLDIEPAAAMPAAFSEDQLALDFTAEHCRDWRYVKPWGEWLQWTRTRWCTEETLRAYELVRRICRAASAVITDAKLARAVAKSATVAGVERLARGDRAHAMRVDQYDTDKWRFNQPSPKEETKA